jgi:hypothetical protein
MRTLLRSIRSGEYLQSPETWTPQLASALDFKSIPSAVDLVRRRGLKDMELVLADEPAHITAVPIAKLAYPQALFQGSGVGEAPPRKVVAVNVSSTGPAASPGRPRGPRKTKAAKARPARAKPQPHEPAGES